MSDDVVNTSETISEAGAKLASAAGAVLEAGAIVAEEGVAEVEKLIPRDETHDSVDPQTGALTPAAISRRATIMDVLRGAGHDVQAWSHSLLELFDEHGEPKPGPNAKAPEA